MSQQVKTEDDSFSHDEEKIAKDLIKSSHKSDHDNAEHFNSSVTYSYNGVPLPVGHGYDSTPLPPGYPYRWSDWCNSVGNLGEYVTSMGDRFIGIERLGRYCLERPQNPYDRDLIKAALQYSLADAKTYFTQAPLIGDDDWSYQEHYDYLQEQLVVLRRQLFLLVPRLRTVGPWVKGLWDWVPVAGSTSQDSPATICVKYGLKYPHSGDIMLSRDWPGSFLESDERKGKGRNKGPVKEESRND